MTKVKRYRKKPVVIEAMEWDGTVEGATPIIDWVLRHDGTARYHDFELVGRGIETTPFIDLETLEGRMKVRSGDFVIKGLKGEFYPHAGSFFHEAYDEVTDEHVSEVIYGHAEYADNPLVFSAQPVWLLEALYAGRIKTVFKGEDYWYARVQTANGPVDAGPDDRISIDQDGNLYVVGGCK